MELTREHPLEWRFSVPYWWRLAFGLVALTWIFTTFGLMAATLNVSANEALQPQSASLVTPQYGHTNQNETIPPRQSPIPLLVLLCTIYVLGSMLLGWKWLCAVETGRAGQVHMYDDLLEVIDWRGKKSCFALKEIDAVALLDCSGFCHPHRVVLMIDGQRIELSYWLVAPKELLDAIVTRQSLICYSRTWLQHTYIRPREVQSAKALRQEIVNQTSVML